MYSLKTLLILFVVVLVQSCGSGKKAASADSVDYVDTAVVSVKPAVLPTYTTIDGFFSDFETAVLSHNPQSIIQYMDKDYKKEQHDEFLKGNTTQFLNEFFSGTELNSKNFITSDYTKISKLTRTELQVFKDYYLVTYIIVCDGKSFKCTWTLMMKLNGGTLRYGLYGAVG